MKYGGITLAHVLAFQIRIMMGNQYERLVEGMRTGCKVQPVIACLRLGWNDAFRHTSENTDEAIEQMLTQLLVNPEEICKKVPSIDRSNKKAAEQFENIIR